MPVSFDPYYRWLGIPPKDQPANHYRLLGLNLLEPDLDVIRDAAEQRIAHVRTYQLGVHAELSQKILNELAAAKSCLLDPQRKAAYDAQLSPAPAAMAPKPAASDEPEAAMPPALVVSTPTVVPPLPHLAVSQPDSPRAALAKSRWLLPTVACGIAAVALVGAYLVLGGSPVPISEEISMAKPDVLAVKVRKGETAKNSGAFAYHGSRGGTVTIKASPGSAVVDNTGQRWCWSYTAKGQQKGETKVTITVTDGKCVGKTAFTLSVEDELLPTVVVDKPEVAVDESCSAVNSGHYTGNADASLKVSIGQPDVNRKERTWIWSYSPSPADCRESKTVKIYANGKLANRFTLNVRNVPPTIAIDANKSELIVTKGETAEITGTYRHPGSDVVKITATGGGTIIQDEPLGTWRWSYTPTDDASLLPVTITATDSNEGCNQTTFRLVVKNRQAQKPPTSSTKSGPKPRLPPEGLDLPAGLLPHITNPTPRRRRSRVAQAPVGLLRTGTKLTQEMLDAPQDWQRRCFPDLGWRFGPFPMPETVYVVYHQDMTRMYPVYPQEELYPGIPSVNRILTCQNSNTRGYRGKFDGYAALLDGNGRLKVLAYYKDGELDGDLRIWDDNHVQRYYGEYRKGAKNGLTCFFRNGCLQLIRTCRYGSVQDHYFVRWTGDSPSLANDLSPEEEREKRRAITELKDLEEKVVNGNIELMKTVKKNILDLNMIGVGGNPQEHQPDRGMPAQPGKRTPNGTGIMPQR
jgi:hypothetical protein